MSTESFDDLLEQATSAQDDNPYRQSVDEETWRYACSKTKPMLKEGREIKMKTDKGVYAGKWVRDMIESRQYRPESYTWLGHTENPKRGIQEVGIPHNALFKHTAIFGNSGYGKSTVMKNMMLQWAQANFGFCFIDPKGDDSLKILRTLPEHRKDDLIWVEPGATDKRETVGFNVLDTLAEPGTPEQESEADAVVEDLVALFEMNVRQWSPQMSGAVTAILSQMIRAKEEYTLVDLYKVLDSSAEQEAFLDMYGDQMDKMDQEYIENIEQQEISPLIDWLKQIVSKPMTRKILASEDSNASIAEAVENDKLIVANFSNIGDDNLEFLTAAVVRRLWSTIKARKDIPEQEREPYFLCIDEFDGVTRDFDESPDMLQVDEILSTARSFRLSVLLANQNPTQLEENIKQDVYGNCNNLFTFNQGNFQDAGDLSNGIKDIEGHQIMSLSEFRLLGRLTIDGDKTPGLLIHTFPEYPPLRSEEASLEVLDKSCQKYGVGDGGSSDEFHEENYGVIRYKDESEDGETLSSGDETITLKTALTAVAAGQANPHMTTVDGAVSEPDIRQLVDAHTTVFDYDDIKNSLITPNLDDEFTERMEDGVPHYALTDRGREKLREAFASDEMADLLLTSVDELAELGYLTTTPTSDTVAFQYDLIAKPPINPVEEAKTMETAKDLAEVLQSNFPDLYEQFQDNTLVAAVVPDPLGQPRDILTALAATDDAQHCLFIVPAQTPDGDDGADAVTRLLQGTDDTPPLVKADPGEGRDLYMTSQPVDISNNMRGLHRADEATWFERDGAFQLETEDGDVLADFDTFEDIDVNATKAAFPYYAEQIEDGEVAVKRATDEESDTVVQRYDSFEDVLADGFSVVNEPLVPERAFPTGSHPPADNWSILTIPADGSDEAHFK